MLVSSWLLLPGIVLAAQPYSEWLASSAMARGQGNGLDSTGAPIDSYEHGAFQRGLTHLYEKTGNKSYLDYIQLGLNNVITSNGTVLTYKESDYSLDNIRIGESIVQFAALTGEAKYKTAADTLRKQLETHPRNKAGGFWHKLRYPYEMWGDGQYMGLPFYAAYTSQYQPTNQSAWADIALQINLYHTNCRQNGTNLTFHGYDESKTAVWANNITGASPEVWDRAMGWYSMALVDLLDYIPSSHPGYATILSAYQELAPALVRAVDPASHAWWLVISEPGRAKNYIESSGSSMFVYSILKGLRKGYIEDSDSVGYFTAAQSAYQYITKTFVQDAGNGLANFTGTVIVGSLDGAGDFNYYVSQAVDTNDLKGIAAFVLASVEYENAAV